MIPTLQCKQQDFDLFGLVSFDKPTIIGCSNRGARTTSNLIGDYEIDRILYNASFFLSLSLSFIFFCFNPSTTKDHLLVLNTL